MKNYVKVLIIVIATAAMSLRPKFRISMVSEKTIKYFNSLKSDKLEQAGGAGGSSSLEGLKRIDSAWNTLKNGGWKKEPIKIVFTENEEISYDLSSSSESYDVCVCGGTLGIFYSLALQLRGYKTCVIERALVQGRSQEWNISKKELNALIRLGILTQDEIDSLISIEFNPVRVGFTTSSNDINGFELLTTDILNTGVRPDYLIDKIKLKYLEKGGRLYESSELTRIDIFSNQAVISFKNLLNGSTLELSSAIVIDAMGNASPIAKQIRGIKEPDGICIVVGTCARGYQPDRNTMGDVIYTNSLITKKPTSQLQYFWEAFPAGSGKGDRTTYLFTYIDAKPNRPSVAEVFDDYWDLLPSYQNVDIDDLEILRILYGVFPTYRNSPLQSDIDRILQVGDASGIQSPLSFGGFGSLTRHIERIITALDVAIQNNLTSSEYLSLLNPYQPNLSAGWMFQRSMSVPIDKNPEPNLITSILSNSFKSMESLGNETMRPFLQDVIQFYPLLNTLFQSALNDFFTPLKIIPHVGPVAIADFLYHMIAMFYYTWAYKNIGPIIQNYIKNNDNSIKLNFKLNRLLDKWKYGSGLDYYDHE